MLFGGRLKKFLAKQKSDRISDSLRAGIVSLLSVILVLFIAQWAALFSVALIVQRAHLTEIMIDTPTDAGARMSPNVRNSLTLAPQTV